MVKIYADLTASTYAIFAAFEIISVLSLIAGHNKIPFMFAICPLEFMCMGICAIMLSFLAANDIY
jgi:hypothetical protein